MTDNVEKNVETSKITAILENIINPITGKTLKDEGRILEIKTDDDELHFLYKRDGISPEMKRKVESNIETALAEYYPANKLTISTQSMNSEDIYKGKTFSKVEEKSQAPSARLNIGHGPAVEAKTRVTGVKTVLAVSSNKGGVGKSTVAVNLAFALKARGKKVGILDADIYGPSIPMLLNQRNAKPVANENKKILPIDAYGIPFISFGLFIDEKDPVIWRGPMLGGVLNQFLFDVHWGELDYLIIDLPPGTGDMQLSLAQAIDIDGALVVSTPQDIAILDSRKGLNMFNQVKVKVLGMIENMSYFVPDDAPEKKYFIFGEGGVKKAALELEVDLLAEIPLEIALREGSDTGLPYMNEKKFEGRPVWNAYMGLAKNIELIFNEKENDGDRDGEKKGFFKRLFS